MGKQNKKFYIGLSIVLLVAITFIFFTYTTEEKIEYQENTGSATISAGEIKVNLPVSKNTLFYDALVQAKNTNLIDFSGKNYPSLGFFVTDIGTLHSGNGKNLLYYINGKEAIVGVSSYVLNDGDVIEWKLE